MKRVYKVYKVYKVHKVHKVYKVRGPPRGAWSTAAHAADKHRPKDTRDLMDFIDLMDFTDLLPPSGTNFAYTPHE